jgi:hypothetical protein
MIYPENDVDSRGDAEEKNVHIVQTLRKIVYGYTAISVLCCSSLQCKNVKPLSVCGKSLS